LISLAAIVLALIGSNPQRRAACFVAIAFAFQAYLYVFALPALEAYRTQKPFAEAVKERLGSDIGRVALFRTREIVYYLDKAPLAEYHTPRDLVQAPGLRWIILRRQDWESLGMTGIVIAAETVQPWEGDDQAANKLLLVEVDSRRTAGD
jgi:hypothetical protein